MGNLGLKFVITDTKLHVSLLTLSVQDNTKLLEQLKSSFKRTTNWGKYEMEKLNIEQVTSDVSRSTSIYQKYGKRLYN